MVKTRHNQEAGEESDGTFPSLEAKRMTRTRASNSNQHEDSDDSGVDNFRQCGNEVLDDSLVPKRSARSSVKRVTYVEDYVDEVSDSEIEFVHHNRLTRRGRPARRLCDDDVQDDQVTAAAHESSDDEKIPSRGRGRRQNHVEMKSPRRHRRTADYATHSKSKQVKMEQLADIEDSGVRRSSRNRSSLLYDSFNKKVLENSYEDDLPHRKRRRVEVQSDVTPDKEEFTDIYSRVKRQRKVIKRDMYGMQIETDNDDHDEEIDDRGNDDENDGDEGNDEEEEDSNEENDDDDDDDDDNKSDEKRTSRSYNLRENKPRTQHYIAPIQERRRRIQSRFFQDEVSSPHSPARRHRPQKLPSYMSPARKRRGPIDKRRRAFHGSSSTSSSSSDSSSSDEERFQRRKAKSMLKARQRCLPMNFDPDDITRSNVLRDRQKIGSSLADVDPMNIDKSITFSSVGGLGKHVRALKEMVVFPLMYPEIFERFKIAPPRGVLFYGPPGTGKTLMARALANECSTDEKRVAFYMRKGADCLSKWVGESERQLRLLFDQAYQTRPSIIFFDEIDGLAPVRSSRQDQIHSSIVSTLLALMDGLDSRGEIVVIGATNRLDSIDPALRRPGRFDREFLFPLPSVQARSQILKIHTKEWNPRLCDKFVSEVAEKCIGYCGADMKALCTEVALLALRRRYPQIYTSSEKLQIDVTSININAKDFYNGMQSLVPASQRSVTSPARALDSKVVPLLQNMFVSVVGTLNGIFPSVLMQLSNLDAPVTEKPTGSAEAQVGDTEICSDDEDKNCSIYEQKIDKRRKSNIPETPESFMTFRSYACRHPSTHRPRLLLSGNKDQGQTSHLAPAVIHHLEQLPVQTLDISALFACSARSPEESCAHIFREARRTAPSIIYLPHINQWWSVVGETVRSTLLTLIHDLDPSSPVLLLATSEESFTDLDCTVQDLFDEFCDEVFSMRNPNSDERREYFKDLLLSQAAKPPASRRLAAQRALEVLPRAPPPVPRKLTDQEIKKLHEHEEATLTELRLFLRDVLNKLGRDRKFFIFTKPVDIEDVPDYYDIIKKPMDLSTMMSKIDLHHYQSVKEFLTDINQICLNALEYNPDKDPQSRVIRHRACALKDTTNAIIKTELDSEFEKLCETIIDSRKKRGEEGEKTAPSFYHTRPLNSGPMHPLAITKQSTSVSPTNQDLSVRLSRRLQGVNVQNGPSLEDVERNARALKRLQMSPEKEKQNNSTPQGQLKKSIPSGKGSSGLKPSQGSNSGNKSSSNPKSSSSKKPVKKDIWGSKSYRSRKRRKFKPKRSVSESDCLVAVQDEIDQHDDDDVDDDNDAENGLNDSIESIDMEDMETEEIAIDGTVFIKSPRNVEKDEIKSARTNSPDKCFEKLDGSSSKKDSLNECLSVDVSMKSPKDGARSPASQRSPRSETQKSPQAANRSHNESPKRSRSPRSDSAHTSTRHSSGSMKSPRSLENSNETEQKPRTTRKSGEKQTKSPHSKVVSNHDETTNQCNSVPDNEGKTGGISVEGFVDSGVGSSDSNGDSNDSVGKLSIATENNVLIPGTNVQESANTQGEQHTASEGASQKETHSPVFHLTRSRVHTKAQEKAVEILNEQQEPFIIDMGRLVQLLDNTVLLTQDYTVPRLEKLYSMYGQCIFDHRKEFNRTEMITTMEKRLKQYTTSVSARMKSEQTRDSLS